MKSLFHSLQDYDIGHLRVIAELWGLEFPGGSSVDVAEILSKQMLKKTLLMEIIESLPAIASEALKTLILQDGSAPLADYSRSFGGIREMGPGRRDREKPWRDPTSPLEILWYRGLIGRAFAESSSGVQEFAFIPNDLMEKLPVPEVDTHQTFGYPIPEPAIVQQVSTNAVDDAITLLADLRCTPSRIMPIEAERSIKLNPLLRQHRSTDLLLNLLTEATVLKAKPWTPDPEALKVFLEHSRIEVLHLLLSQWSESESWNDLQHVPGLDAAGGNWPNDPLQTRQAVLDILSALPLEQWWSIDGFIRAIHEERPGFQRPAGDFDSWYLQDPATGEFLDGFSRWGEVEGRLLRYIISGPLHWLGAVDLGMQTQSGGYSAFRLNPLIGSLLHDLTIPRITQPEGPVSIYPDGKIRMSRYAALTDRYQIARICECTGWVHDEYHFQVSPSSLQSATDQGLELNHIFSILKTACDNPIPKSLIDAIHRWGTQGCEAILEQTYVLRVKNPDLLEGIQSNRKTARYLKEILGPNTVIVRERDWDKLRSAAAKAGLLIDTKTQ
ncbi:MAG: hypothetical protein GTO18_20820 [Anaerolineales bacterium]|nr:hypothetical protein [Anaerolineales bacterium]